MRAIITVIGQDTVGILSNVSSCCAENNINVLEVTQSVLQDYFCMIMLVDVKDSKISFADFNDKLAKIGEAMNLVIRAVREDIFNAMHKI